MGDLILEELKSRLRPQLVDILDVRSLKGQVSEQDRQRLRGQLESLAAKVLRPQWRVELNDTQRQQLLNELLDETLGLGLLEPLMKDETVSEIMINGPSLVFVERHGRIEPTEITFQHRESVLYVIERLLSPTGRRVNQAEPYVDARLPDGARVNIVLEPIAVDGPYVTIRKRSCGMFSLERLLEFGTITREAAEFLGLCVQARLNIVISGGASSGKTTLLNVLGGLIPQDERVVVIEDTAEIELSNERHVARLETRPPNVEWRGEVTIRHLVKNALHMRPDRILVGEVRGEEALVMLQAMNTGHDGSMTTLHANSPLDVLDRIEMMALMSRADLSHIAVERQVRSAVDLIVHMERWADGSRRLTQIASVRKGRDVSGGPLVELFTRISRDFNSSLGVTDAKKQFVEQLIDQRRFRFAQQPKDSGTQTS